MPQACSDLVRGGNETDTDCGGGECPPCENGQACDVDDDCEERNCVGGFCAASDAPSAAPSLSPSAVQPISASVDGTAINATASEDIRYKDTLLADGTNTWCSGNSPEFSMETNALCLPREECEALCTSLGDDCMSCDWHSYTPDCVAHSADSRNFRRSVLDCIEASDSESNALFQKFRNLPDSLSPLQRSKLRNSICPIDKWGP